MVRKDLNAIEVGEDKWYHEANDSRARWRPLYRRECDVRSVNRHVET